MNEVEAEGGVLAECASPLGEVGAEVSLGSSAESLEWASPRGLLISENSGESFVLFFEADGERTEVARFTGEDAGAQLGSVKAVDDAIVFSVGFAPALSSPWAIFAWSPGAGQPPRELARSIPDEDGVTLDDAWAELVVVKDRVLWTQVLEGRDVATLMSVRVTDPAAVPEEVADASAPPVAGLGGSVLTVRMTDEGREVVSYGLRDGSWEQVPLAEAVHAGAAERLQGGEEPLYLAVSDDATVVIPPSGSKFEVFTAEGTRQVSIGEGGSAQFPRAYDDVFLFTAFTDHAARQGPAVLDVDAGGWAYVYDDAGGWVFGDERVFVGTRPQGNPPLRTFRELTSDDLELNDHCDVT